MSRSCSVPTTLSATWARTSCHTCGIVLERATLTGKMSLSFKMRQCQISLIFQPVQSGEFGLHHLECRSVLAHARPVAPHHWLRGSYGLGHSSQGPILESQLILNKILYNMIRSFTHSWQLRSVRTHKIDWISTKGDGIASHYLDHGSQLDVGHHHIRIHSGAGRYVPGRLLLHTNEVR